MVLEADAPVELLRGVGQQVAPAAAPLEAAHLGLRALDVAEVGQERAPSVGADHGDGVRPREPGQPADVDEVGDDQGVESLLAQALLDAVGARAAHRVSSPLSSSSASR